MSTTLEPTPTPSANFTKPLWVAVGVLTALVLVMGGGLIYTQTRPAVSQVRAAPAMSAPAVVMAPPPTATADDLVEKQAPAVVKSPSFATKSVVQQAPVQVAMAPTGPPAGSGYVVQAPPMSRTAPPSRAICTVCGTVESVTPVERKGKATGLGAVGGGVLGAVVGNQFGGGSGRAATTILGAVGGGFAGNAIEKNVRKTTVYEITVRMENGSLRHFERSTPVTVGARVRLIGNTLHLADAAASANGG